MYKDARPIAIQIAQQIASVSNARIEGPAFGILVAELVLQNIIVSMVSVGVEPGSKEGEETLTNIYNEIRNTAIKRWHKQDLKDNVARNQVKRENCTHCIHYQNKENACCACGKPLEGEIH